MPESPDFDPVARRWFVRGALSVVAVLVLGWVVLIALHARGVL